MKKQVRKVVTIVIVSTMLFMGASLGFANEFSNLEQLWGKPVAAQKLSNGTEQRFYSFKGEGHPSYIYFTSKGGSIVDQGITDKTGGGAAEACDLCGQKGC